MSEENKFKDYKNYISKEILDEIQPKEKKRYVAVLKIKYPKKEIDIRIKKADVIELLKIHNESNKGDAYIEMLEIKNTFLILGLELPDIYDIKEKNKKQVSRYIGICISRKLYHDYGWGDKFSNKKNALFSIVEIKKIDE